MEAMGVPILVLGAVAVVVLSLNVWATGIVRRQTDVPPHQRRLQLLFIWLLPMIGAMITGEVYRRTTFHRPRQRLVADEIHPIIDQAARPLADAATRASERYIEKELTDFGHDAAGHGHSDSPH
jgi:hypothetical protein